MSESRDDISLELRVSEEPSRLPFFLTSLLVFDLHFTRNLSRLWQNRYLLYALTIRGIRGRYKQSLLGIGWALLTPAAMTLVFSYVFSRAGLSTKVHYPCPFPIYALCMLTFWNFFQRSVGNGSTSLVSNMDLVTKVYFPREVLPLSSVLMNLVDWAVGFVMFLIVAFSCEYLATHYASAFPALARQFGTYHFAFSWRWLWVPVFLLLILIFVWGLVFFAATMQVYFRDVAHLINLALFLWLFLTPVLYPLASLAGGRATTLIIFNPMTGLLDGVQMALLIHKHPWEHHTIYAAIVAVVFCISGYAFFKHEERYFADVV